MIRLYHRLTSGNSYNARLLLSILQLEYEPVAIELERGRIKVDEVAAASRNACCCVPKRGRVSSAS